MLRYVFAIVIGVAGALIGLGGHASADAPACNDPICWRIENRFRLFADKTHFKLHEDAWNATTADGHSVLAMERFLNGRENSPRDGWAAAAVDHLCFDESRNATRRKCKA